jgi:RNA-directed DNA polymerase
MEVTLKVKNIKSWFDVYWFEINTRIYRLQVRIYRASQNGDRDKAHKSKKLLTVGDSAKLLAVIKVIPEDEVTDALELHTVIYLSLSKRLELARSLLLTQ